MEGTHPVAYSGLFSHANYPDPVNLWVYEAIDFKGMPLLDGLGLDSLYIGDRTAHGRKRFVPTRSNIKFLPKPKYIPVDKPKYDWARFRGFWGVPRVYCKNPAITCVRGDGASKSCPSDQSFISLLGLFAGVKEDYR